jgi:hypothetical protein
VSSRPLFRFGGAKERNRVVIVLANPWNTGVNNMAKDPEPFQSLTGMAQQTAEQIAKQTQGAMENYFSWLQNTMSASPWGSTDLNKKLLSYATENVTAAVTFVQKLSQAKDFQEVVKIQTEFVQMQIETFNRRAKELGAAVAALTRFDKSS